MVLNDKTLRLFAADCAEHVADLYEKQYPGDTRVRKAIQAARDYANGLIDKDAAYAAAKDAYAFYVAYADYIVDAVDADYGASAACAAYAAYAAARDILNVPVVIDASINAVANAVAFNNCTESVVCDACEAERKWQTSRLEYYLEIDN